MPRVSVMLSDKLYARLEEMAEDIGMSRSSVAAFAVGQFINSSSLVKNEFFGDGDVKKSLMSIFNRLIEEAEAKTEAQQEAK